MSAVNNSSFSNNVPPGTSSRPMQQTGENTGQLQPSFLPVVPSQGGDPGYWTSLKDHLKRAFQGLPSAASSNDRSGAYAAVEQSEELSRVDSAFGQSSTLPGDDEAGPANVRDLQKFSDIGKSDFGIDRLNHSESDTRQSSLMGPQAAYAGPSSVNRVPTAQVYNSLTDRWEAVPTGSHAEMMTSLKNHMKEQEDLTETRQREILQLVRAKHFAQLEERALYNNSRLPPDQQL